MVEKSLGGNGKTRREKRVSDSIMYVIINCGVGDSERLSVSGQRDKRKRERKKNEE